MFSHSIGVEFFVPSALSLSIQLIFSWQKFGVFRSSQDVHNRGRSVLVTWAGWSFALAKKYLIPGSHKKSAEMCIYTGSAYLS
jgi:hypothetical protein